MRPKFKIVESTYREGPVFWFGNLATCKNMIPTLEKLKLDLPPGFTGGSVASWHACDQTFSCCHHPPAGYGLAILLEPESNEYGEVAP